MPGAHRNHMCLFWVNVPEDPALYRTTVAGAASSLGQPGPAWANLGQPGHFTAALGLKEAHLIRCWKINVAG